MVLEGSLTPAVSRADDAASRRAQPSSAAHPNPDAPAEAREAASRRPGGSTAGRLMWRSRTRTAGIRFEWAMRSCGPVLRVVATWTDRQSQPHHTSFSVQCNGLEGALDRAIAARVSCGAPMPNREDLLQRLQQEFVTAPYGPCAAPRNGARRHPTLLHPADGLGDAERALHAAMDAQAGSYGSGGGSASTHGAAPSGRTHAG